MNKAVSLDVIGERQSKGFIPGRKVSLKGVIYGVSLEISMVELVRGIEGARIVRLHELKFFVTELSEKH